MKIEEGKKWREREQRRGNGTSNEGKGRREREIDAPDLFTHGSWLLSTSLSSSLWLASLSLFLASLSLINSVHKEQRKNMWRCDN